MQSEYRVDKIELKDIEFASMPEGIDSVALGVALSREVKANLPTSPPGYETELDAAHAAGEVTAGRSH